MTTEILDQNVLRDIRKLGPVDVVVGIPSYGNASTIAGVAEALGFGMDKYYQGAKVLMINSDGGSKDGTPEAFLSADVPDRICRMAILYKGTSGKGSALRAIFEVARETEARICIVADADSRSITPDWARQLGYPVFQENYGYVTPFYLRDKHDATITNSLVYPVTRALYGQRIRQPIGGDFALSRGLVCILRQDRFWESHPSIAKFGVDIWMTTTAICEGLRICQAALGVKIHDPKKPSRDLSPMFRQMVGTMFELMKRYDHKWLIIKHSQPVDIYGEYRFSEIEDIEIHPLVLLNKLKEGYQIYGDNIWKQVLSPENYEEVSQVCQKDYKKFIFPMDLWARAVFDFAVYYCWVPKEDHDSLLESMIPLYQGRTASFAKEMAILSDELADAFVDGCASVFERLKPYLLERWPRR
ncbi:glucosylglycerate synthase [Candidatus Hakubella thermalkaliphila]|uniref:Glucosylglycerate synthase n=1 Tax=Candidatus Hakubella thermalkaliphila TaxID=2754717 RepID=A0A6V8NR10_9ACTN|nr:hypothetical protein [Candidatus Hakubella thermalkaliphila]GFP19330.1 glucosylglycerate synthase [Candidatus Hakubella thermalkaliphila]GFP22839.1 glucosylglycerate synthase [Candidatus Hakubella thermalkaliphila]GFP29532.1 glucosylglycerate synthase [Candidatus Hakubella thermalkaliphila]GFP38407.1 glucosylglycerate synthase [Candidatus Hakubella thermalkaliphila]GFP40951.1 glucosylglycerate synthase [Candidatus Hakubella thermalkaliphila]